MRLPWPHDGIDRVEHDEQDVVRLLRLDAGPLDDRGNEDAFGIDGDDHRIPSRPERSGPHASADEIRHVAERAVDSHVPSVRLRMDRQSVTVAAIRQVFIDVPGNVRRGSRVVARR